MNPQLGTPQTKEEKKRKSHASCVWYGHGGQESSKLPEAADATHQKAVLGGIPFSGGSRRDVL